MKVVAFLGETFYSYEKGFFSYPYNAAFIQSVFGEENSYFASPADFLGEGGAPDGANSLVGNKRFYAFEGYSSTADFLIKILFKKNFYRNFVSNADRIIDEHADAFFWVRSPSAGSLLFALRVIKSGRVLIHHMCADGTQTWKDAKYKGLKRIQAFLASRLVLIVLKKICSYRFCINLTTGDILQRLAVKFGSEHVFQFVDLFNVSPSEKSRNKEAGQVAKVGAPTKALFIGRVVEDKGILDLIDVCRNLSNIHLTVIGDGADMSTAKSLSNEFSLSERVVFMGHLNKEQIEQELSRCDVVVVPSKNHYEGFPRVIMEAWSHSKPVIVSACGGVKAFLVHEKNGLIFDYGSKNQLQICLKRFSDSSQLREQLLAGASSMADISNHAYWRQEVIDVLSRYSVNPSNHTWR